MLTEVHGMNDLAAPSDRREPCDRAGINQLFSALYPELHRLAHCRLRRSPPVTGVDTTSLLHDAYLRLLAARHLELGDRLQFLAFAAHVMRSVIIDLVRRRRAGRRGGGDVHVPLNTDVADRVADTEDQLLHIDEALRDLAEVDARLARVVEMRYFAGLREQEIAESLGLSVRTVRRDWERARLFLRDALQGH